MATERVCVSNPSPMLGHPEARGVGTGWCKGVKDKGGGSGFVIFLSGQKQGHSRPYWLGRTSAGNTVSLLGLAVSSNVNARGWFLFFFKRCPLQANSCQSSNIFVNLVGFLVSLLQKTFCDFSKDNPRSLGSGRSKIFWTSS